MKSIEKVNVFDFDKTIYDGDASVDFILFCLLKHPRLFTYLPHQIWSLILLGFGFKTRKDAKQEIFSYLEKIDDVDMLVNDFWKKRKSKIKAWYLEIKSDNDIIITASPEFLILPIGGVLKVKRVIGTNMNQSNGQINGENCRGSEKVRRFSVAMGDARISTAFSDSMSDLPILSLADNALIVKKSRLIPIGDYKAPFYEELFSPKFLRFLFVGGVNALLGILFSFIISLYIDNPILAFVIGYSLSLIISYFLNASITFKNRDFSLKQFLSFCISYIPNFVVVLFAVFVLIGLLNFYPLVGYTVAAIVAAPITFLLLSQRTFRRKIDE